MEPVIFGLIPKHLRIAIDPIGSDRIMFGSDLSATGRYLQDPADLYTIRKHILDNANLTAEERENIMLRTANNVIKLGLDEG